MDERLNSKSIPVFKQAFLDVYLSPDSVTAEDVQALSRPFLWWNDLELTFEELEHQMRGVMARLLALVALQAPPPGTRPPFWLADLQLAVAFIDGYVNRQEVEVAETTNPVRALRDACHRANKLLATDPEPLLARVPEMQEFHEGWRGILGDEAIALEDRAAFGQLQATCSDLVLTEDLVYNIVRKSGRALLPTIEELLPQLLPADQLLWLHGLDAFPSDPQVIALYERVMAGAESSYVKAEIGRFLERVRSGTVTTGFEM